MKNNFFKFLFFILIPISLHAQQTKLVILHSNDMHSKLTGFGPESDYTPMTVNDDKTLGGFARMATVIKNTRKVNPDNFLLLDAGDFLMGSIFHAAEPQTGFQLSLMKELGYDFVALGNHEFDFGPQTLGNIIAKANQNGKIPQILCSNIVFSKESAVDDNLENEYNQKLIQPYQVFEKQGIKIGIFSLMGIDAASVAPNAKPVSFENPLKAAARMVDILKNQNHVDFVICLSHSGVYPSKEKGFIGEDVDLAQKVSGIDLIISGHTHVETPTPFKVNNTYIVQTGCYVRKIGYLELNFKDKKLNSVSGKLISINDSIPGDPETNKEIETYKNLINKKYFNNIGLDYKKPIVETDFELTCHTWIDASASNLGPLIADADYYFINKNSKEGTDVTLVASGTVREDILPGSKGIETAPDIFRVASLGWGNDSIPGYPLSTVYLTGKELKGLVEVMLLAQKSEDSYIYYSGIKIFYNPGKMMLRRVKRIEVKGKDVDFSKKNPKLYRVSANSYLLSFVGRIKTLSHGLVKVVPKSGDGKPLKNMSDAVLDFDLSRIGIQERKEWLAIISYLQSFADTDGNGIPNIPEKYKNPESPLIIVK
jgi:5'-nucleotidase